MNECPQCRTSGRQVKAARTPAGSQRYRCGACSHTYTPAPKARGYPPETRAQAVRQYVDGGNLRRTAHQLGAMRQTVVNWVAVHAALLARPPQPAGPVETAELDEIYTYVGHKKTPPMS